MSRAKINIPKGKLKQLYLAQGLSPARIAVLYKCTSVTVRHRLIEAGIPLKTKSVAQSHYPKRDCDVSDSDKAYMLGFRYGDLNVYQPGGASHTIVVRCHTTHLVQERLFQRLFKRYGTVTVSRNPRSMHMNCYLNESFSFLLGKYPPQIKSWLSSNEKLLWAFAAGYVDAEGTFGLNQGKGRFKIDAYDYEILADLYDLFIRNRIKAKFRIIAFKGNNDYGWVWKKDVWRLSVNEAGSLEILIHQLLPFLLHAKRTADAHVVLKNIQKRRKNGTIR